MISVGLLTAKLDHFFMAAPYIFFLACCDHGEYYLRQHWCSRSYIKRHPRNGLIMGNLGTLQQLELKLLVVKLDSKDGTWRRPSADHEVVKWHLGQVSPGFQLRPTTNIGVTIRQPSLEPKQRVGTRYGTTHS